MDDLVLVALPTAVTCAELFVQFALTEWSLLGMREDVTAASRDLVRTAVANNDPRAPRFITVRLSLHGDSLTVEVDDRGQIAWRELPLPTGMSADAVQLPRRARSRRAAAPEQPAEDSGDVDPDVMRRVFAALSRSAEPE